MKRLLVIAALCAMASITACATAPPSTPAQAVYATTGAYTAALTAAVAYKRLPPCSQAQPREVACSSDRVVAELQKADDVAFEALSAAQRAVRTPGFAEDRMRTAVAVAGQAVQAFYSIATRVRGGAP